jgi:hypothetical protein
MQISVKDECSRRPRPAGTAPADAEWRREMTM